VSIAGEKKPETLPASPVSPATDEKPAGAPDAATTSGLTLLRSSPS
jgi:hypothetical protein